MAPNEPAGEAREVGANRLYYGDNLDVLRKHIPSNSIDLVYLDPPFNSNQDYNVLFRTSIGAPASAQIEAFDDTWRWGNEAQKAYDEAIETDNSRLSNLLIAFQSFMQHNDMMAYLSMMAIRLVELHRVLKPTGSFYLHCDAVASHYLKILLDAIFGLERFRSEIIWRRSPSHNKTTRQFGPIHDTILYYTKSDSAYFAPPSTPYSVSYIESEFRFTDERGRYRLNEIMGPGARSGESGQAWRGYDPSVRGRHWAIPASLKDHLPKSSDAMSLQQQLDELYRMGLIVLSRTGRPKYKQYPGSGITLQDIWAFQPGTRGVLYGSNDAIDEDVKWLSNEEERLGYPTQKPLGLLRRIIQSSSKEGDIILDPFCGCGTAVDAAESLQRRWIGIDITYLAIDLISRRMMKRYSGISIAIEGAPKDIEAASHLASTAPYQFQIWAVSLAGGRMHNDGKRGADGGIDGVIYFRASKSTTERALLSIKGGQNIGVGMIREFRATLDRERASIGIFISLAEPTKPMLVEAAAAGSYQHSAAGTVPRIQILTIRQMLTGARPKIPLVDDGAAFRQAPRFLPSAKQEVFAV